jgi:hypothetical protein
MLEVVRKMTKVLEILDVFDIEGKGTVIIGVPQIEESRVPQGSAICVRRSGQDDSSFEVLDRELMRNDWSPDKPRSLALLISREHLAKTIPRGSEVWLKS